MNKKRRAAFFIVVVFFISLFFIDKPVPQTFWSVIPPLTAIVVAYLSGHLILSLGSAVFLGTTMLSLGKEQGLWGAVAQATVHTAQYFVSSFVDSTNILILGFVFFILSMVHVVTSAGGLESLVLYLKRWVVGPRSAQFVTALLGCLIFIDDYANTMIVGSTMKSVTDKYKISREKLAFLVDATSAPIAGIALVSTWIGYEVGLFSEMSRQFQWSVDGYGVFLEALSFRYYCLMMLIFVFINIFFAVDYGPMKKSEEAARNQPDNKDFEVSQEPSFRHLLCALLPIGSLLLFVLGLLWWDGGGLNKNILSLSDWHLVLMNSQNGTQILFFSSLASYVLSIVLALFLARLPLSQLKKAFVLGVKSAGLPIVILVLAWSMKLLCDEMQTGEYVVLALKEGLNPIWLPLCIFIVAAITAFSTGTSWGTMAILIPTVTPLALSLGGGEYGVYVALCLAAILDGAIMGDHCSPISDTTIMSSISTECDLLSHVKTQLPYSLTVGSLALILGYLPAGLYLSDLGGKSFPLSLTLLLSLLLLVGLFFALQRKQLK